MSSFLGAEFSIEEFIEIMEEYIRSMKAGNRIVEQCTDNIGKIFMEMQDFVYIGFYGGNCDETEDGKDCDGWDGTSRRCECGNRRVWWVLSDDNKKIMAQAW